MIKAIIFDCFGVFYADAVFTYMRNPQTPSDKAEALHSLDDQASLGKVNKSEFVKEAALLLDIPTEQAEQQFFHSNDVNQQLLDFSQNLRKQYKVSLLSNIGADMMDGFFAPAIRQQMFDDVILSGEIEIAKPDPEIFQLACKRLGVLPFEAIMIDDVQGNIDAAKNLGMQGICYKGFEQFKTELQAIIL